MKEGIFRKTSIERVNSPEQLNEYIRVANPGVWLTLAAIAALLIGACIWGIFGRLETTAVIPVVAENGIVTGYFPADMETNVESGMELVVGDKKGSVISVSDMPIQMGDRIPPYVFYLGGFKEGDFCFRVETALNDIPDGVYEAKVILDSVAPISFVIQ